MELPMLHFHSMRQGPFNPVESFVHAQNLERTPPEKGTRWMYSSYALACILFGTHAFLVLYLSSSHSLMDGESDSWPDYYYLTCNRSAGGVPDTDRMFCGRLLTRNAWKLTNNGCEMVVHGTKLMTYIFWGIIKCDRCKNILQMFKECFVSCTFILPCTCPLLVRWLSLIVLYMYGNRVVIVCMCSIHRSWEPRAAAGTTFITG